MTRRRKPRTGTATRRAVRARMAATGQTYINALREIRAEQAAHNAEEPTATTEPTHPSLPTTVRTPGETVPPLLLRAPQR